MKAWLIDWQFMIVILMSAGLTALGLWTFVGASKPVPTELLRTSGVIESIELQRSRWRLVSVNFTLHNSSRTFAYSDVLPNVGELSSIMANGMSADVTYINQPDGRPELWSLTLDGHNIIDVAQTYQAHRNDGYWGLVLAFASAICGVYLWRVAVKLRAT